VGDVVVDEQAVTVASTKIATAPPQLLSLFHSSRNNPRDTMGIVADHLKNQRLLNLPAGQVGRTQILRGGSSKIAGMRTPWRAVEGLSLGVANVRAKMMVELVIRFLQAGVK
jgi:hypothetical protein